MGSHANFKTCEDLSDLTDIKQTDMTIDDDYYADGNGQRAVSMIKDGSVIFYLIKEGDWNLKDPLGRFAEGVYCENDNAYYGYYSHKFKNFVKRWIFDFDLKFRKTSGLVDKNTFWQQPVDKLVDAFNRVITNREPVNKMNGDEFVRGLIEHKCFDVIIPAFNKRHTDYRESAMLTFVNIVVKTLSTKIFNIFPEDVKQYIFAEVNRILSSLHHQAEAKTTQVGLILNDPDKFIAQFKGHLDIIRGFIEDDYRLRMILGFDYEFSDKLTNPNSQYSAVIALGSMTNPQMVTELKRYIKILGEQSQQFPKIKAALLATLNAHQAQKDQQLTEAINKFKQIIAY